MTAALLTVAVVAFAAGWWWRGFRCGEACRHFDRVVARREAVMFDRGYRLALGDVASGVRHQRLPDGSLVEV